MQIIECDLQEIDNILITEEIDTFFHLGWTSDFINAKYNEVGQFQNVECARKAMLLAERSHCKNFLSIGSQAECGLVEGCITINTPRAPISSYAKAKIAAYDVVSNMSKNNGIKVFWPRLLSAYGPFDRSHTLIMSCIYAALLDKKILMTNGTQVWDYIYVDDVSDALLKIVEFGRPMIHYPIGSGIGRSLKSYIVEIAKATSNIKILESIGKKKYEPNQVMNLVADCTDLEIDTGFSCKVAFSEGIRLTIEYAKETLGI